MVVQSTHKQLSSMTQAAMLHQRGGRVCRTKLARALQARAQGAACYLLSLSLSLHDFYTVLSPEPLDPVFTDNKYCIG